MLRRFGWLSLVGLLSASASEGALRYAVLASGDCEDSELLKTTARFAQELNRQMRNPHLEESFKYLPQKVRSEISPIVLDDPEIEEKLGGPSPLAFADMERAFQEARKDFLRSDADLAEEKLRALLTEVQRLPPGPARWDFFRRVQVLLGLSYETTYRHAESNEAYARILRLDPTYPLAPTYATSTRAQFDRVRRATATAKKARLKVTSQPSGANVYLDGLKVGVTPFSGEFPLGDYDLQVSTWDATSMGHPVSLKGDTAISLDLETEGAIDRLHRTCFRGSDDVKRRLRTAARLGTYLKADELIVVRLARRPDENWLEASTVEVQTNAVIRVGHLKLTDVSRHFPKLVDYAVTGTVVPPIEEGPIPKPPLPPVVLNKPPPVPAPEPIPATRMWSFGLFGASALSIGLAAGMMAISDRQLNRALDLSPSLPVTDPTASRLIRQSNQWWTASEIALGLAAGCAGLGAALLAFRPSAKEPGRLGSVSVDLQPALSGFSLNGSF